MKHRNCLWKCQLHTLKGKSLYGPVFHSLHFIFLIVSRYYFGIIKLIPDQIRLSVKTASKLPKHLQRIKRKMGLTLIKFEDAAVDLQAFERKHPFETREFLFKSIIKHFKDVCLKPSCCFFSFFFNRC